jgi:hypothetical protein
MSEQIIGLDLFVELSTEEQQLLSGGKKQDSDYDFDYKCKKCYCKDCESYND